jgi:iron complex outermembrane receptor protein
VFKGPQGTLYGRNATGGAIVVETNAPTQEFGGDAGFDYGNFNYNKVHAVINLPISDTLAIRIAGQEQRSDGYSFNIVNGQRGDVPTDQDARIKIGWTPFSGFTAIYSLEYLSLIQDNSDGHERLHSPECLACTPGFPPASAGFYDITTQGYAHNGNRQTAHTLNLTWNLGPFVLNNVSGFRTLDTVNYDDNQLITDSGGFFSFVQQAGHTFTEDLYAKSQFQGPLNFLSGASYERDRQTIITDFAGFFFPPGVHNTNDVALNSYSVYADLYYDITPALKFTAGARYNEDKKSIEGTNNEPASLVFGTTGFSGSGRFPGTTPHAVLSYDAGTGYYYVSFSRGVRSGGFTTPAFTSPKPLGSEKLDSYEIGAKNRFLDNTVRTSAALFYGTYSDMQVLRIDPINGVVGSNAGKSRISGLEFDVTWEPVKSLDLTAGGTALHDYFLTYPNAVGYEPAPAGGAGLVAVTSNLAGTQLPRAPSFSGYVGADYTQGLSAGWTVTPSIVARYTNTYNFFPGGGGPLNLDRQSANTLTNGSLMVTDPSRKLSFGFWGANIGDVHYFSYASTNSYGAFYKPAQPRTFGVRFDYKF